MLHPLLAETFRALDRSALRWCLLRVPADLSTPRGDIDMLVEGAALRQVTRVLTELGFVRLPRGAFGRDTFFLSYHRESRSWIWLHVATELNFGPYHLLHTHVAAGCLARAQRSEQIVTLSDDDAFWALLLHCLLDKRQFSSANRERLRELVLKARADGELGQVVRSAGVAGWPPERLMHCVREDDWAQLSGLASPWSWFQRSSARSYADLARDLFRQAWKYLRYPSGSGFSVTLLGPDGAGKSTLARGISDNCWFPVRSIYMGLAADRLAPVARFELPGLGAPGRLFTLWWRYLLARYHQMCGHLVIFDRYTFDILLPPPRPQPIHRRLTRWMLAHACPPPDLALLLDLPGEVMYRRKGERNPAQLEQERRQLLALQRRIPRSQVVDATRSLEVVQSDVLDRIWSVYRDRWNA